MPIKCYNKPNRSGPRYFREADVARIFCNASKDTGATWVGVKRRVQKLGCYQGKDLEGECEELRDLLNNLEIFLAALLISILIPESIIVRALIRLAPLLVRIPGMGGVIKLLEGLPRVSTEIELFLTRIREVLKLPPP